MQKPLSFFHSLIFDSGPPGSGPIKDQHFIDYAKAFDCVDHSELWKILKELGIPDYLTCLLGNLYAGQEGTVRTVHGTTDWFLIGKGVHQAVYFHLAYLTYMQSTS